MRSVEFFAGAGGLALGISRAGFSHDAVVEWDADSCRTIKSNQENGIPCVQGWDVRHQDAREFDYGSIAPGVDLVAGGPPCQPFSLGGKHQGNLDTRDMFPVAVRAVRELKPRVVLFENVKGILRSKFSTYFEYIKLQLGYPDLPKEHDEDWTDHLERLERCHTSGGYVGTRYKVLVKKLNAADYGVPQKRERVFFVGIRADLGIDWSFEGDLKPTHSLDALLWDQWVTSEYWDRHGISADKRPSMPKKYQGRVKKLQSSLVPPIELPWRTVRDALHGLPDPRSAEAKSVLNHRFNPGARKYPGHTGSPWDEPAKTLKAGDHGVPGGENMLAHYNGQVRYFTTREAARLQTFPDEYRFEGAWTETMRQIGNAVPVELAHAVASSVHRKLEEHDQAAIRLRLVG